MKIYSVTIQAVITKTFEVKAENERQAYEDACELFSSDSDQNEENYTQDLISVNEVTA
jgi:hypothetical protein